MIRLTFPIIFILLSAGLFFGFIDPTYEDVKEILKEEEKFDQALDKSKELQKIRDELLSRYNTFSISNLDRLTKLLPDNVDNVRLVLDIDHIASVYGMRIKNVTVKKSEDRKIGVIGPSEKPYESVKLSFSISSSYEDLIQFVKDIEKSLRIVDVVEISLIPSKMGDVNLYEYDIGVKTYWLK
ncbi:MAG: type 4a pilus biogenesis protein PilO [Candidatus Pacebacteria bacterium]|jgi:Tfp pilus assembly protein PilO|nr:type 4a pilus biogenesis protein PilO [Candidatus Paceibacterota bacterium]|tara:strand:+ start:29744 stop:30292 length:549 start_codon:yes stop_codon:yes gene_type:complete